MAQPARLVVPWCECLSCICAPRILGCQEGDGVVVAMDASSRVRLGKAMVRCWEGHRGGGLDGRPSNSNVRTHEVLTVQPCNITIFMLPNIFILSSGNREPSDPISRGTEAKTLGPFESSARENPSPRRPFLDT